MKHKLICLILGLVVFQHGFLADMGICLAAKKSESAQSLAATLSGTDGPAEIVRRLAAVTGDADLDQTITDLGKGIAEKKSYEPAAKVVDLLLAQGELRSSMMAGSLLVAIINNVELNSFAVSKDSHYNQTKSFTRVPFNLPSPWEPADLGPPFLNKADNRRAQTVARPPVGATPRTDADSSIVPPTLAEGAP